MENLVLIQLINPRVRALLETLEELNLIEILEENTTGPKTKLSEKYRGVFSKEDAQCFDAHTQAIRKG